ncbi:MAG: MerR family transcriptional regulator, partial [Dermatophilaceae bacterium]
MKVAQLTRRAGVTKATVQYYLRRDLLHPGTPVTAKTSPYDDTYVAHVRLVRSQGWKVSQSSPARKDLERALTHARAAGLTLDDEALDRYAEVVREVVAVEVNHWSGTRPGDAASEALTGAILLDPVLAAMRRLAQDDITARTLASSAHPAAAPDA